MKTMNQFVAVAVLAAGSMAVLPGCQNSGSQDNTSQPAMTSTTMYDRAYVASRDTEWIAAPESTTRNPLARGTRVYFAGSDAGSGEWRRARVEGQGVVWVRAADFASESR